MNTFPNDVGFTGTWRKYQTRILDELHRHLEDNKFHVVTPPGSGKTILGLEICCRLNRKTVVLVPTIALRDQWINRFVEFFIVGSSVPSWINTDINTHEFFSVFTYQAVLSKYKTDKKALWRFKESTFVLDEAHHLKNEWWKLLEHLSKDSEVPIIGLTATPPIDSSALEWNRYITLLGPVDAQISVPELVRENDLCPHQDYIYLSIPTAEENENIKALQSRIRALCELFIFDEDFENMILSSPWIQNFYSFIDDIYTNIDLYKAIKYFQESIEKYRHVDVSMRGEIEMDEISDLSKLEVILKSLLSDDPGSSFQLTIKQVSILKKKLKSLGVSTSSKIRLDSFSKLAKILTNSTSKMESIIRIIKLEDAILEENLRLVVLCDYIRSEYIPSINETKQLIDKMGVVPIFESLRNKLPTLDDIAVLTGSVVVIPSQLIVELQQSMKISDFQSLKIHSYPTDNRFSVIENNSSFRGIVAEITRLFECGSIRILIGTKSLLGEGWDSPSINSLVLASFVGSFVSSNQMRGRALRKDPSQPDKVANIWHLCSLNSREKDFGQDFIKLQKRFSHFAGPLRSGRKMITIGIDRVFTDEWQLELNQNRDNQTNFEATCKAINDSMFLHAMDRQRCQEMWKDSLGDGEDFTLYYEFRHVYKRNDFEKRLIIEKKVTTRKYLITAGSSGGLLYGVAELAGMIDTGSIVSSSWIFGAIGLGVVSMILEAQYFKWRNRDFFKSEERLRKIAKVLLQSFEKYHVHDFATKNYAIKFHVEDTGHILIRLVGASDRVNVIFCNSMMEILSAGTCRYFLVLVENRYDLQPFVPIPGLLSNRKASLIFLRYWQRQFGKAIIYSTNNEEGKTKLIEMNILAGTKEGLPRRITKTYRWN